MNIRECVQRASWATGVSVEDIRGRGRSAEITEARSLAILMARDEGYSLPQIGNVLGRHHTTILFCERAARKRILKDRDFATLHLMAAMEVAA